MSPGASGRADVCVIRNVGYLRAPGWTAAPGWGRDSGHPDYAPGAPAITHQLPWDWYATATEDGGHTFDADALLEVVTTWVTAALGGEGIAVTVTRVEDDAMHGRPPLRPADPFVHPARFHVKWATV